MMTHTQKPDFVFPRNGRVHLNRWGSQFSRLLAAEVCASAWVMLDRPRSEVAWEYWLPTRFASFPFTSPPVRHRVPSGSERALPRSIQRAVITNCNQWLSSNMAYFNWHFRKLQRSLDWLLLACNVRKMNGSRLRQRANKQTKKAIRETEDGARQERLLSHAV